MKFKLMVALIVLFAFVPALAQKKRPTKKKPKTPVAVVSAEASKGTAPAAPAVSAKKRVPHLVVTAESSETAIETGVGIVLSETPYSGAEPSAKQGASGATSASLSDAVRKDAQKVLDRMNRPKVVLRRPGQ